MSILGHFDTIDALASQIAAITDLLQCADSNIDIASIRTAAEMNQTLLLDLMAEVEQVEIEYRREREERQPGKYRLFEEIAEE